MRASGASGVCVSVCRVDVIFLPAQAELRPLTTHLDGRRDRARPSESREREQASRWQIQLLYIFYSFSYPLIICNRPSLHPFRPPLQNTASASRKGIVIIIVVARECGLAEKMKRRKMRSKNVAHTQAHSLEPGGEGGLFFTVHAKKGNKITRFQPVSSCGQFGHSGWVVHFYESSLSRGVGCTFWSGL